MTLAQLFSHINSAFQGSDDDAPTEGTDFNWWLNTTNRKIADWATDDKNVWDSLFSYNKLNEPGTVATIATTTLTGTGTNFTDYQVGDGITVSGETERIIATIGGDTSLTVTVAFSNTVTANTFTERTVIKTGVQSYNLPRNFMFPSDKTYVTTTTQSLEYAIGKPQERNRFTNEVYISGDRPQVLTFSDTITSDLQIISGSLAVPGYYQPDDLAISTDIVPVDDPYWLVMAVASELAFNNLTYADKAPDLNAKANDLYSGMVSSNRRGNSGRPRIAITNVDRIRDTRHESYGSAWDRA